MALEFKTKKLESSIGIVIPAETLNPRNIKPEENVLKELFGAIKFNKSSKQLIKELRSELESKSVFTRI